MTVLNEVLRQCGFIGTLIVGGPDPDVPDNMMTMIFQTGKTATGLSFGDAYPDLKANITNSFNTFAHKCLGTLFTSTLYQLGAYECPAVVDKGSGTTETASTIEAAFERAESLGPSVHVGENVGETDGRSVSQNVPKSTNVEGSANDGRGVEMDVDPPAVNSGAAESANRTDGRQHSDVDMDVDDNIAPAGDTPYEIPACTAGASDGAQGRPPPTPDDIPIDTAGVSDGAQGRPPSTPDDIPADTAGVSDGAQGSPPSTPDDIPADTAGLSNGMQGRPPSSPDEIPVDTTGVDAIQGLPPSRVTPHAVMPGGNDPVQGQSTSEVTPGAITAAPVLKLAPIKFINGMSEYEWQRQENIKKNNALLAKLGLDNVGKHIFGMQGKENNPPSKLGRKKAAKSGAERRILRSSAKAVPNRSVHIAVLLYCR